MPDYDGRIRDALASSVSGWLAVDSLANTLRVSSAKLLPMLERLTKSGALLERKRRLVREWAINRAVRQCGQ